MLDRFLSSSTVFPTEYGFIRNPKVPMATRWTFWWPCPSRRSLVVGALARPVAVLWLEDQGKREPKVVCVPCEDPNWESIEDLDQLPDQPKEEIAHLFVSYKSRESHEVEEDGWEGRSTAEHLIEEARRRAGAS